MRTLARYAWASPCSAVGLLFGLLALPLGARWRQVDGTLEIALGLDGRPGSRVPRPLPFRAITFGHVILGISAAELSRLRRHERAHVAQYEAWGPLFFLAYPASSAWQALCGRRAYFDNHFEVQARADEDRGNNHAAN